MRPVLSVITPVYQGRDHIARCLESVIGQHCPAAEHIIVDGGSTDGTPAVIREYSARYPHIRFVSEPDRGQSHAMNKGIGMALGSVIGFLNDDDYYEPGVLNRVLGLFDGRPEPSFLVGNCYVRDGDGRVIFTNKPGRLRHRDLLLGRDINQPPFNASAYFYHKSVHEKIGLYDEDDHYAMDLDFVLRASRAVKLRHIDEYWGNYLYAKGTKTYDIMRLNLDPGRYDRIMAKHFNALPLWRRLPLRLKKSVLRHHKVRYFYNRIGYYAGDPLRIIGFLHRSYRRILGEKVD